MTSFTAVIGRVARAAVLGLVLAVGLAAALPLPAWAGPLEDAKTAGLVGERPDGYLGIVAANPTPDVTSLVNEINTKRLAAYGDIATKNGTSVEAVGAVTAQKLYNDAPRGTYLMVNGRWVQK